MGVPKATQAKRVILPVGGEFDSAGGDEPTAPDAPSAPSLTVGDTQLSASWAAVSGATTYDVIYNTSDSTSGATAFSGNPVSGTSAVITGLTNDTAYYVFVRATNAAGSSAYSASATATPTETAAGEYTLIDGVFTLTAPVGVDFGTKPNGDKPWFVWYADDHGVPSSDGRLTTWNYSAFNGTISDEFLLPGATQSAYFDLSVGGASMGRIDLPHEPDSIFMGRAVYADYTGESALSARMRYNDTVDVTIAGGQWLKGRTTGATGKINRYGGPSGVHLSVYMEKDVGTSAYPDPTIMFEREEIMDVFAEADVIAFATAKSSTESAVLALYDDSDPEYPTPLGNIRCEETGGIFYTFNHKVFRLWGEGGNGFINAYNSTNITRVTSTLEGGSGQTPEDTSATFYDDSVIEDDYSNQWTHEHFTHRNSTLDTYDGKRVWRFREKTLYSDVNWRTRTTTYPRKQRLVVNFQVSNGCEPGTRIFHGYQIIDDSEYQVFLVNDADIMMPLPPITWNAASGGTITAKELPYLPDWTRIEVWINLSVVATYPRAV